MIDIDFVAQGILWILVIVLAAFIAGTVIYGVQEARAHRECLMRGYPNATVDWRLNMYCSIRIDQTDHVIKIP